MVGTLLASFLKGHQGHTGSASCLSLWERWMRPTGADGEGAPAPLRGAAAAAAEGPANRRSAKNAFSEAASIFPLRQLLWGLKGASSPLATGCGTQHPLRALGGIRVLLAAAPTTAPCFRRWRRSQLLHCGVGGVQRKGGGSRNTPPYLWPSGASCALRRKRSTLPSAMNKFKRQRQKVETFSPIGPFHCTRWQNVLK